MDETLTPQDQAIRGDSGDTVFVNPETVARWGWMYIPPHQKASDPNYIKHVHCEGARFHVLSYSNLGVHCSEPNCIKNKPPPESSLATKPKAGGKPK